MRNVSLVNDQVYHICNRSTENIEIFGVEEDARRFLKNLKNFNTTGESIRDFKRHPCRVSIDRGEPLVEVYAITLMPNHFHILAKQLLDNGITKWLHRTCNSFSHSFNLIRNRKGTLFMGRFKAIPVLENRQLFHLLVYIHSNPLDLAFPKWREGAVGDWSKARDFLNTYKWSSWGLYKNQMEVLDEIKQLVRINSLIEFINKSGGLESGIRDWGLRESDEFKDLFLEN